MKKIMVAPLNWGLGHATRCIPIIQALLEHKFEVLIASDGASLDLLKKEFPALEWVELPSYKINYPSNGRFFKLKMMASLPQLYKTMVAEKKMIKKMAEDGVMDGIISDGRFGARVSKIPCAYITHQLNVLTGKTTFFSTGLHKRIIKKFDACWVPDVNNATLNHSGKLGHLERTDLPIKYFGIVSRMKKDPQPKTIDILALISGPEPQRTLFEIKLLKKLEKSNKKILIVRGVVEDKQVWNQKGTIEIVNYMQREELEKALNKSELVICRSGYSSIMDLSLLEKKVFFVPTPGQYEQEYLARRLNNLGVAPYCKQNNFKLKYLNQVPVYQGLRPYLHPRESFSSLFSLFHGK